MIKISGDKLFDRAVSIIEQAKSNVVKVVNSNMIIAYWLVGREIVEEIQQGEDRAGYGKQVIKNLSTKLTQRYGKGFSVTNIKYFRLFFQTYIDREPVIGHSPSDVFDDLSKSVNRSNEIKGFSPFLSWTHYRTLTKVEHNSCVDKLQEIMCLIDSEVVD